MPRSVRHQLLLVLISGLLFFINLGSTHLWDVDEAIFSESAKEMFERGDAVVPTFNGQLFTHKPAMMYWLMMHGYQMFGTGEFAARFYSAVFGIGTVLVTYRIARLMFSPTVAFWSGLMLATSINFCLISRAATPDSFLGFYSALAMLVFVSGTSKSRPLSGELNERNAPWAGQTRFEPSWPSYALFYAVTGLGVLTKGPIGVVLPTASVGLFLLVVRAQPVVASPNIGWKGALSTIARRVARWLAPRHVLRTIWSMRPLTAVVMVLLVAGPWYTLVGLRTDGVWVQEFFGVHNFGRFLGPMENHSGPIFYYLVAMAAGFFPWSILAGPSLIEMRKQMAGNQAWKPGYVLACSWLAVWVGFFSLAGTKLPSYVVPAYPALALVTACFAGSWLREPALLSRLWTNLAWGCVALTGVGLIVALPIVAHLYLSNDWPLGLLGLIPLVAAVVGWIASRSQNARLELTTLAALGAALCVAVFGFAATYVDRYHDTPPLLEAIRTHAPAERQPSIAAYHQFRPSYVFYGEQTILELREGEAVQAFFAEHPSDAYLITNEKSFEHLKALLPSDIQVLSSQRRFLRRGNTLVLGRSAATAAKADASLR